MLTRAPDTLQDLPLFNDTIYYNILYGRLGASQDDIYAAAKKAAIHDQIVAMPDGSALLTLPHCYQYAQMRSAADVALRSKCCISLCCSTCCGQLPSEADLAILLNVLFWFAGAVSCTMDTGCRLDVSHAL